MTVHLIGGEMLLWSDLDGKHGPVPAGGAAFRALLGVVTGRTLVAGPHDPGLVSAIAAEDLTLLVRGIEDAEALDARWAGRPGVIVRCGSLQKLEAVPAYDTVVALDGLDRLCSAEAADLSWAETLDRLVAVLRPGGRLLLGTENLFGVHRLVALPPVPADTDWVVTGEPEPGRPAGPARLRARLATAGLTVVHDYAAYPSPRVPSVLLGPEILAEPELTGFLAATLGAAVVPDRAVLADPARLAVGALHHGLAADLAPGWVTLAHKGPGPGPGPGGPWPDAVLAAAAGDDVRAADRPQPVGPWPDAVLADGDEVRLVRLDGDELPRGCLLEDLLLAAGRRRNLPVLRELLTAWQAGPAAGVPAGLVVVDADGRHTALGSVLQGGPGSGVAPLVKQTLAAAGDPVAALRGFAATVIRRGEAGVWPAPADEAGLTVLLAGMTGRELEPGDVPTVDRGGAGRPEAIRELTMDRDRLARELAEARAKHGWYESMLAGREAELKRVRQLNALLRATVPGRAATTLVGGLRAGKRAVRAVVRRTRG